MTRLMRDSTNPAAIPTNTPMVAGYVDCSFAWSAAGWARFPNSVKVRIAAGCNPQDAQVADVERGDYLPWEAVDFVIAQRAKGIDPTVYTFYDNWGPTRTEFSLRGVPEPHWWIALFDGVMELLPGTVASQRRNSAYTGADYDESIVADFWPGVDNAAGGGSGGETLTQAEFDALVANNPTLQAIFNAVTQGFSLQRVMTDMGTPNPPVEGGLVQRIAAAVGTGGGGTEPPEPPEPAEPKTITLNITSVPGTATGTIS